MPEKVVPGPVQDAACIREAVCIHTKKIFDSCRDKDCIEDLRFYPTQSSQCAIDRAISIKAGTAELLYVYIDVEPVGFNRGFYTVDVRYFYRVTADAFVGAARPVEISGLCVFDKRVILFGSEGSAKIFSSEAAFEALDEQNIRKSNLPTAVVEAGALYLRICCSFNLIAYNAMYDLDSFATGVGCPVLGMVHALLHSVVMRLGLSWLFAFVLDWGYLGLCWAEMLAPFPCALIGAVFFLRGRWRSKQLI